MRVPFLAAALLASCGPEPTQEQRAIQVAYVHAQQQFAYHRDIERLPPTVEDEGDHWLITFHIPPEMAGGAPMVEIRKSDLSVQGSASGQ